MKATESKLKFLGYKIISIEFQVNPDFANKKTSFMIEPELLIEVQKGEKFGAVNISCAVFTDKKEAYPFNLSVKMQGAFLMDEVPEEKADDVLNQNAVAIMYPYLRSAITSITQAANIKPLVLPIINVAKSTEPQEETNEK